MVDTDGAKLISYSSGFEKVWSEFTKYKDLFLEDKLINEIQSIVGNAEYKKQILAGEIVVLAGTSIQHLDINIDKLLLHNWHVCFRNLDGNIIGDIVMEPASLDEKLGIKNIIKMSDLG